MKCTGTEVILLGALAVAAGGVANLARSGNPEKYLPWTTDIYAAPAAQPAAPSRRQSPPPESPPPESPPPADTAGPGGKAAAPDVPPPDVPAPSPGGVSTAGAPSADPGPAEPTADEFPRIGFERALEEHEAGTTFVDARRTKDYNDGHITGAVSISPYEQSVLAEKLMRLRDEVPEEAPVVVYCTASADCEDSALVSRQLVQVGFQNIMIYKGGFPEWDAKLKGSGRRSALITTGSAPGERDL